ncbi:hypothetical protein CHUAL_004801 [Chamberlinius hualienensis]
MWSFIFVTFYLCAIVNGINSSVRLDDISRDYALAIIEKNGGGGKNLNSKELYLNSSQFEVYSVNCSSSTNNSVPCKSTLKKCYNGTELLKLVHANKASNKGVSVKEIQLLCPILLHNVENIACATSTEFEIDAEAAREHLKPSSLEVWGYGFLFVTIISLSSVFGAALLPMMGKAFYHRLLQVLVGLAVGSLSGSAAFHLIPQAYGLLDNPGNHDYLFTSLIVLCGIYLFFMVERLLRIYFQYSERNRPENLKRVLSDVEVLRYTPTIVEEQSKDISVSNGVVDATVPVPSSSQTSSVIIQKSDKKHHHEHKIEFKPGQESPIATVAWMIVFGDGLHNFIDGLSIGAAFNQNVMTGISISVAVVCEELPHELGDMAILLNSGMTMKQALMYNFLSACTCYLGLIVGTLLGELAEASVYIFALAAGVFLYISLCDMIPEMNEEIENASRAGVWDAIKVIGLQNIGWVIGTAILFTLAYFTEEMSFE